MRPRNSLKALILSLASGWMATGGCLPDNFYSDLLGELITSTVTTFADTLIIPQIMDDVGGEAE